MKRLSLTYFLYFAQLGVLIPYLGIFLDGRGFSSSQIGELFALITFARIFGPSLWASLADRSGKVLLVLRLGCLFTVLSFVGVFWAQQFWWLTLCFGLMMMFWTAVLPQLEVVTLRQTEYFQHSYGNVRLWGSIGFIVLTVLTGHLIDIHGSEVPVVVSTLVLAGLFLSTLLIADKVPKSQSAERVKGQWHRALRRTFILFIVSATLLQVSFGVYYGFFALYMRDLGYSGQTTGIMIALGVVAEVIIFMLASRLIARVGVKWLLIVSCVFTGARWQLLGAFGDDLWLVALAQLIHAFSFGLTHAASVHFIFRYFDKRFQSRAQAIYISVAFGFGGALGNWFAGHLWQDGAGAQLSFTMAAGVAVIAGLVLLPVVRVRLH
ncbi:MFS transporter [Alteromonas oceanisediminis]|uniref:MFS transporter n=1 Tax=Alteromonas oceanisediminis TaxID=2836180 RepID=UPI001BD9F1E7|nr:MFS transporter [Alteromonas oceanisediminis]MBT0584824.1 MFS transporter [Alteromonas oceanisediminis]